MRHRIIISALEIVEAGFGVVVVASVAQGVEVGNVGAAGDCYAVCVGYADDLQDRGRFCVLWLCRFVKTENRPLSYDSFTPQAKL